MVVAIGLLENNVAVVIGAMVIAPLLGPNIALALGAALGDMPLIWKAFKTGSAGIGLALFFSIGIGIWHPMDLDSPELMARTDVGVDSMALALASGAAAVISLTTGLSSVLVGVMVAVALLPPTATLGIMLECRAHSTCYWCSLIVSGKYCMCKFGSQDCFFCSRNQAKKLAGKTKGQSIHGYLPCDMGTFSGCAFGCYIIPQRTLYILTKI